MEGRNARIPKARASTFAAIQPAIPNRDALASSDSAGEVFSSK
jgi:hypothetical protein